MTMIRGHASAGRLATGGRHQNGQRSIRAASAAPEPAEPAAPAVVNHERGRNGDVDPPPAPPPAAEPQVAAAAGTDRADDVQPLTRLLTAGTLADKLREDPEIKALFQLLCDIRDGHNIASLTVDADSSELTCTRVLSRIASDPFDD